MDDEIELPKGLQTDIDYVDLDPEVPRMRELNKKRILETLTPDELKELEGIEERVFTRRGADPEIARQLVQLQTKFGINTFVTPEGKFGMYPGSVTLSIFLTALQTDLHPEIRHYIEVLIRDHSNMIQGAFSKN